MVEQSGDAGLRFEAVLSRERSRIVGLCAHLTGNLNIAEDLAQETFVEAWRHIDRLEDPGGIDRWLSAFARNVCLRWRSWQAREAKCFHPSKDLADGHERTLNNLPAGDVVGFDLEREDLARLLDQALDCLPDKTRSALLSRFIEESSYAEIGSQLQLSEGAVKMRVKRGRLTLAQVLSNDLRSVSTEYLPHRQAHCEHRRTTDLWCSICGEKHLEGYFDPIKGDLMLRCSTCYPTLGINESKTYGAPVLFERADTIEGAYHQLLSRAGNYLRESLNQEKATCVSCGKDAYVIRRIPDEGPLRTYDWRGMQIRCESCGHVSWGSLNGLLLSLPEIQHFRRQHRRIRTLPEKRVEVNGRPALVIRMESRANRQHATTVVDRDTFRILELDFSSLS